MSTLTDPRRIAVGVDGSPQASAAHAAACDPAERCDSDPTVSALLAAASPGANLVVRGR